MEWDILHLEMPSFKINSDWAKYSKRWENLFLGSVTVNMYTGQRGGSRECNKSFKAIQKSLMGWSHFWRALWGMWFHSLVTTSQRICLYAIVSNLETSLKHTFIFIVFEGVISRK